MRSRAHPQKYFVILFVFWLVSLCNAVQAETFSDLLVIIAPDGRHYTAQHTLSTDGELIVLNLPSDRTTLHVQFSGPERQTFELAHRENPDKLALWSGSAIIRYQHQFGSGLVKLDSEALTLRASEEHIPVDVDKPWDLNSNVSWLLPDNATLLSFLDAPGSDPSETGRWQRTGNTLLYQQRGGSLADLSIEFTIQQPDAEQTVPCLTGVTNTDQCSTDVDGDQIPDYRDICLPLAENDPVRQLPVRLDIQPQGNQLDELGCDNYPLFVLAGVRFQSGQSYLDVTARSVLDRTALALLRVPDQIFEISAHTDNAGRVSHNQRLSENRADAIRHYLMLRGVSPNQLISQGKGETSPAYDNRLAAGRRANRRVELKRLD